MEISIVYEFIKYWIYSIVIHQQQLEGLFNHYDIKVHSNMSPELQQARIQISLNSEIAEITQDKLCNFWKGLRDSNNNVELDNHLESSETILNTFLIWRKN